MLLMRTCFLSNLRLLALPVLALSVGAWAEELSLAMRTDLLYQKVTGPGGSVSFYDRGTQFLHESDIRYKGAVMEGKWASLLNATVRVTDSNQFDPEEISIQKLEWKLSDARTQINLGDYFANLSPYSMTKSIKGVAFQRNLGDDQNYVRAMYGSFDAQWANFYKDPAQEPMNRLGGGVRLQRAWDKFRLGLNLAQVMDDENDPHRLAGIDAYRQVVSALDWEYRDAGLVVTGEHAYADSRRMPAAGAASDDEGAANKIVARASLGKLNLNGHVERVSSDFYSLGGGATPDRQRWYFKGEYLLDKMWRLFLIYDDFRDNLDGQLATTTQTTTWEGGFRKARLLDRRNMKVSVSWRNKAVDSRDGSRDSVSDRIKIKLNDRIGQAFDWRGELEYVLDEDRVAATDADSLLFDLGVGYRQRLGKDWDVRANLDLGRQETETVSVRGRDISNRLRLSFTASREDGTVLGGFYEYNTANLLAVNADNRHNRASLYWQTRPAWLKKHDSLKFEVSDYLHTFTQDPARDYREQIAKVSLIWNYEKSDSKGSRK